MSSTSGSGTSGSGSTSGSGTTTGSGTCTDTWANYASAFFSNNCAGCHSWASSQSYVVSDGSNIQSRLASGSMPPGGSVSQSDVDRITAWLNCGGN